MRKSNFSIVEKFIFVFLVIGAVIAVLRRDWPVAFAIAYILCVGGAGVYAYRRLLARENGHQ